MYLYKKQGMEGRKEGVAIMSREREDMGIEILNSPDFKKVGIEKRLQLYA